MIDLISRQAVIDTLNIDAELLKRALDYTDIVGAEREKFKWGLGLIESCIFDVEELPSVQSERKKGKWLNAGTVFWQCNQCLERYTGRTKKIPNFCPNCGADMRG